MAQQNKCGYCVPCFEVKPFRVTLQKTTTGVPPLFQSFGNWPTGQGGSFQPGGFPTQLWKLEFSICLKDVKCINKLDKSKAYGRPTRWGNALRGLDGSRFVLGGAQTPVTITAPEDRPWLADLLWSTPTAPPLFDWDTPTGLPEPLSNFSDPNSPVYVLTLNQPWFSNKGTVCLTDECLANIEPKVCCKILDVGGDPTGNQQMQEKDCCKLLKDAIDTDTENKPSCLTGVWYFRTTDFHHPRPRPHTRDHVAQAAVAALGHAIKARWNHLINIFSADFYTDPLTHFYNSDEWVKCLNCPESCNPPGQNWNPWK